MLSEKTWAYITSRHLLLSRVIAVVLIIYLIVFVPWLIAEGYVLDLQSRIDGRHEERISNYKHTFKHSFLLGAPLGNDSTIFNQGGIELILTNVSSPRTEILNASWIRWIIPSNYTQLVLTLNTSSVSLANLTIFFPEGVISSEEPIIVMPGESVTMVLDLESRILVRIRFKTVNAVAFDVWGEPAGDAVVIPNIVILLRKIHGMVAPPLLVTLAILVGYLSFQAMKFHYMGWKIEKTRGLKSRIDWEREQLMIKEKNDTIK